MNARNQTIQDLFATAAVVQRLMRICLTRDFDEIGVAPSQLQLLQLIEQRQSASLKTLASDMHLTPGAITQLVEGLVRAGYVTRTESSEDRRISVVALTPAGSQTCKLLEGKKQALLAKVVADMDDNELKVFLKVQQKMLAHLEENCAHSKK